MFVDIWRAWRTVQMDGHVIAVLVRLRGVCVAAAKVCIQIQAIRIRVRRFMHAIVCRPTPLGLPATDQVPARAY